MSLSPDRFAITGLRRFALVTRDGKSKVGVGVVFPNGIVVFQQDLAGSIGTFYQSLEAFTQQAKPHKILWQDSA